jgi:hypothetical protein
MDDLTEALNELLKKCDLPPEHELIGKKFVLTFEYRKERKRLSGTILGTEFDNKGFLQLITSPFSYNISGSHPFNPLIGLAVNDSGYLPEIFRVIYLFHNGSYDPINFNADQLVFP